MSVDDPYDRVRDVFVYDSEGRLVENARLFDQNGDADPARLPVTASTRPSSARRAAAGYPYCPQQAPFGPRPPAARPVPPGTTQAGRPPRPPAATGTPVPTAAATPTARPVRR